MLLETNRSQCPVLDQLGDIKEYFLDKDSEFDPNSKEVQRILGAIWHIAELYAPFSAHLSVPSLRLEELGLISQDTAHKMRKRITQALGSHPLQSTNQLVSEKTENGFKITEQYVDVEGFYAMNGDGARLDHIVRERMHLTRDDNGVFHVKMEQAKISDELHAFQTTWVLWVPWVLKTPSPEEFEPIKVTPRRLNTTLALFVEGTRKGYIK